MHLPDYKRGTNRDNYYAYFKYTFLAPIALLRIIGLITSLMVANYTFMFFPMLWNHFFVYIIAKFIGFFCGFVCINIKNKHLFVKDGLVTIYNHSSFLDGFLLCTLHPFSIVIKAVYAKFIKGIVKASNGISVEKNSNCTQKIINHIHEKRGNLLIAPEGTCTNGKYLINFNLGAFIPLVPVQPILIHYHYKYFNPSFSENNKLIVLYKLLTQFVNHVTIEILPLQQPLKNETPKEFAERVRTVMAQALNLPTNLN